jgi:hypothetical protein
VSVRRSLTKVSHFAEVLTSSVTAIAGGYRPLHQAFGDFPALRGVELKPYRRAARRDRVLDRGGRHGGQDLQMVARFRRIGDRDLGIGVKGAVAAGRRDHDRAVVFRAEDLAAHVDAADIDQPPRPQCEVPETFAVGAQGRLVIGPCGHVTEMRRRNILFHHRLEVEDVQRLLWIGDQPVELARRPVHRVGWTQTLCQRWLRE